MASATLSQLGQIALQQDIQNRVAIAMNTAAIAIYNEGSGVTGHANRALYATKVLTGQYSLQSCVLAVMSSSTILAEATMTPPNGIADVDISNQISACWNAFAGA